MTGPVLLAGGDGSGGLQGVASGSRCSAVERRGELLEAVGAGVLDAARATSRPAAVRREALHRGGRARPRGARASRGAGARRRCGWRPGGRGRALGELLDRQLVVAAASACSVLICVSERSSSSMSAKRLGVAAAHEVLPEHQERQSVTCSGRRRHCLHLRKYCAACIGYVKCDHVTRASDPRPGRPRLAGAADRAAELRQRPGRSGRTGALAPDADGRRRRTCVAGDADLVAARLDARAQRRRCRGGRSAPVCCVMPGLPAPAGRRTGT